MKRILLQPAFVLHRRPYRETSFLVELFTQDYGCITVIAKGVRKVKSPNQGLLQPFTPLFVSCSGKGDLLLLTHCEPCGEFKSLQGPCLFAGFYLNELLLCLLQKWDPHSNLYHAYQKTITALQCGTLEEKILRSFEKYLLDELGYGLPTVASASSQHVLILDSYYRFIPEQGFVLSEYHESARQHLFSGKTLLAIAKEKWEEEGVLLAAKRLIRLVLASLLEGKELYSRHLFIQSD